MTMAQALNTALCDAMRDDPRVVVFGEDVGRLGGVFRVTDGLTARYGPDRCFDTPLAEAAIVGTAIGMAMYGFRPVVEIQFDAFSYPAIEQLAGHAAKMRNRTSGRLPLSMVVRIPYGGGIGGVEHHSDSSEAYFAHTPGLQVATPSTPSDAYTLLRAAIDAPDPVIFLEPKRLYHARPEGAAVPSGVPFGTAVVRRPGAGCTVIAYGPTVPTCLAAAEAAAQDGWDLEIIDLRTLVPFDDATIMASVARTGRAVVVHEAQGFAGMGAEIAARIGERCFDHLTGPVLRVTGLDIPYPPPLLERHHLPDVDRVLDAVAQLVGVV